MSATNNASLFGLSLNAMVALYNGAVEDYAPEGFNTVERFKSKGAAIERIERMCEAGSLAVMFDGDTAVIIDAMGGDVTPADADATEAPHGYEGNGMGEETAERLPDADADADAPTPDMIDAPEGETDGADAPEGETGTDDDADADASTYGDGKGEVAPSGFRRASGDWLKANARGSEEREAYRKARRKAAREARKAGRAAKEAALNEAISA